MSWKLTRIDSDSEGILMQCPSSGTNGGPVKSFCLTVDKLPEEVLLEIFDAYRRVIKYVYSYDVSTMTASHRHEYEFQLVPSYERHWNRKHGWFKLAHVCRKWRRIVLASPTRLDLSIMVEGHNPGNTKTVFTPRLPSLPIRIDYSHVTPTNTDVNRAVAALKQRHRMRGIVFKGNDLQLKKVLKEMKYPFPELERLEICHRYLNDYLKLPPIFLRGSAPRLRRLKLCTVPLKSITQLLSSATALAELSLNIDTVFGPSPTESLVAYLQAMPCLRWLSLKLPFGISHTRIPTSPEDGGNIVPLSKLTFFHYDGHPAFLDELVSGLSAPSLQSFNIEFFGRSTSPTQHISRFITDINSKHHAFRVISSHDGTISLSLLAPSERINDPDPHFNFYSSRDVMEIGNALAPKLAIVEELLLISSYSSSLLAIPWHRFLELFHSVKVLRLQHDVIFDIAHFLQQDQKESVPVLPSLEEIELHMWSGSMGSGAKNKCTSAMEAFDPFIAARQQAGRPVKISWGEVYDATWKFPRNFFGSMGF